MSKSDQLALGVAQSLRCCCVPGPGGRAACPVHALVDHLLYLQAVFPDRWMDGAADVSLPLFPMASGTVVAKTAMQDCIIEAARLLGLPRVAPDGSERVSGHSLRVSGVQGLVLRGWDLWTV